MTRKINIDDIFEYLKKQKNPVFETELLRVFFPEYRVKLGMGMTIELFRAHFILYHHLYRLADKLRETEYFLFIRNIYIYLFKRPGGGHCQFFDKENICFCGTKTENNEFYCSFHKDKSEKVLADNSVDKIGIDSYYLDISNMDEMDEQKLDMISKGIFEYASTYREVNESLDIMGLSIDYTLERLKSRYRYLAKESHPDVNQSDNKMFDKINKAYQILFKLKSYQNMD